MRDRKVLFTSPTGVDGCEESNRNMHVSKRNSHPIANQQPAEKRADLKHKSSEISSVFPMRNHFATCLIAAQPKTGNIGASERFEIKLARTSPTQPLRDKMGLVSIHGARPHIARTAPPGRRRSCTEPATKAHALQLAAQRLDTANANQATAWSA